MTYPINWWYFSHPPLKEYGSFDVCAIVLAPLFTAESTHTIYFRKCLHSLHGKSISPTLAKFTIIIQLQKNPNGQNQKNWSSLSKTYGEVQMNYQCFTHLHIKYHKPSFRPMAWSAFSSVHFTQFKFTIQYTGKYNTHCLPLKGLCQKSSEAKGKIL